MKVILTADIDKVGTVGDVIDVKMGYARNFLFPQKYALPVTPHNLGVMEVKKKKHQKKLEVEKLSAEQQKAKLESLAIVITKKAGENDILFGSVTAVDIENQLEAAGVTIDRKKIHFDEQIKRLGTYSCHIKLFKDVDAEMKIEVRREGEETNG
jgi:large subunit ribosomal protein L9